MSDISVVYKSVDELHAYENNPRINDSAVDMVANSISEFGFKVPMVIDNHNVIVTGHTRLKACKKLGIKKVPCIIADDLSEEQIKAFRLADNKVSEKADWDYELLDIELEDIDLDMEAFGFEFEIEEDSDRFYGDERLRSDDSYNLSEIDVERTAGFYQIPIIKRSDYIPKDMIGFNYVMSATESEFDKCVHYYIDDYQFERIWNQPSRYIDKLKQFDCVLTPDFSLYLDMPIAMKIWNVFRSRAIGQMCQDEGIVVIPTVCWAERDTFEFCFDGIETGSTVSISTVGVKQSDEALRIWTDGCKEMIKRIKPIRILLYGGMVDFDFGDIEIVEYSNSVTERMHNSKSEV